MHENAKRGLFFTPPEQFISPTWVPHLHVNRPLLILTGRLRTADVFPVVACLPPVIGTLRSDDGDGNENFKNTIGLISETTIFARASRFFVHFFAVTARLQSENA